MYTGSCEKVSGKEWRKVAPRCYHCTQKTKCCWRTAFHGLQTLSQRFVPPWQVHAQLERLWQVSVVPSLGGNGLPSVAEAETYVFIENMFNHVLTKSPVPESLSKKNVHHHPCMGKDRLIPSTPTPTLFQTVFAFRLETKIFHPREWQRSKKGRH